VPCAVSSFFEACVDTGDSLTIGARGGGFKIREGTRTWVEVEEGDGLEVWINGALVRDARATKRVVELFRSEYGVAGRIRVHHKVSPPIGAGFGTSGSGALGAALALNEIFGLGLTVQELGDLAHRAEVEASTGLGTVIALAGEAGPVGLVVEPGAPSRGRVVEIPLEEGYLLTAFTFGPIDKAQVLGAADSLRLVNRWGRWALREVLADPRPVTLLRVARQFAEQSGLASHRVLSLADRLVELGAIGAAPNMVGEAVHALIEKRRLKPILQELEGLGARVDILHPYRGGPRFLETALRPRRDGPPF
jgi:pantoate kinase